MYKHLICDELALCNDQHTSMEKLIFILIDFFMFCYMVVTYFSETITDENLFYIVSPKDIIISKERDTDDHIAWLLEREDFEVMMINFT